MTRISPEQARERADATLRSLYANVTDWDRALIVQAIEAIGADGRPFSMNTIRDLLPEMAQGTAGLVFHSLARQKKTPVLVKVGEERSTSGPTHGKPINRYVLAEYAPADARAAA